MAADVLPSRWRPPDKANAAVGFRGALENNRRLAGTTMRGKHKPPADPFQLGWLSAAAQCLRAQRLVFGGPR